VRRRVEGAEEVNNIDPAKVVMEIQRRIMNRIAYAESPSAGIGVGSSAMPIYAAMGFDSPQDYCAARDDEYQMLVALLEAGKS
jgi:hypothetical protein